MAQSTRLGLAFILALTAALALVSGAAAEPRAIESKQAEAQAILGQIEAIDMELARAVDAWNGANVRLGQIEQDLTANARSLRSARQNLDLAETRASTRLIELYTAGEPDAVDVLLGAQSLSDLVDQLETADRVAEEDARIAAEVRRYKTEVATRQRELEQAKTQQKEVVDQRAAQRGAIEAKLAERRALYASVEDQIAKLQAQEQARQARLAAQARAQARAAAQQAQAAPPEQEAEPAAPAPSPSPAPATPSPPAGPGHPEVVPIALRYLGVPYRWGGASPSTGFDCSGFIMYVYAKIGISLPHYAAAQYGYGRPVSRSDLKPGDLVFFNGLGHNGIYIGGGRFVHAPHTGDVVKISSLYDSWYASTWVGARRLG